MDTKAITSRIMQGHIADRIAESMVARTIKVDEKDNLEREFKKALKDGDTVKFEYTKKDGSSKVREITPQAVFKKSGRWAVKGVEVNDRRQIPKMFYLDMIGETQGPEQSKDPKEDSEIRKMFEKSKTVYFKDLIPSKVWFKEERNAYEFSLVTREGLEVKTPLLTMTDFNFKTEGKFPGGIRGKGMMDRIVDGKLESISRENGISLDGDRVGNMYKGQFVREGHNLWYAMDKGDSKKALEKVQSILDEVMDRVDARQKQFYKDAKDFVVYLKKNFDPDIIDLWLDSMGRTLRLYSGGERIWNQSYKNDIATFVGNLNDKKKLMAIVPKKFEKLAKGMNTGQARVFLEALDNGGSRQGIGIEGKDVGIPKANVMFVNVDPGIGRIYYSPIKELVVEGMTYYFGIQGDVPAWVTKGT